MQIMKRIIVAIDGPAASGKSTTAKLLAKKLGYVYLDTGAMYRACALQAVQNGIAISDIAAISQMMERIDLSIGLAEDDNVIWLGGVNVSSAIRTPEISSLASAISAIPDVRHKMVALQRKLGGDGGVVLDGRDIGTVVFPQAEAKFFMIADVAERAKRRFLELAAKGITTPYETVYKDLEARDNADSSRTMAPLKPADDAILIDTSKLSIEEQVEELISIIHKILSAESNPAIQVRLANYSGYCFGVRRAINMAMEAKRDDKAVFTLGEIIHNPGIVKQLDNLGIHVAEDAKDIVNSVVIIRSHGITRTELATLKANNNEIIDATCPYVNRTHEIMQKMTAEGYPVLIFGDKTHPEVIGLLSYGDDKTKVIGANDRIPVLTSKRLCLISQTTQKLKNLMNLACELLPKCTELRVFNTICLATTERQEATLELAKACDMMIVVGGLRSSNTRALAALSSEVCLTHHIEDSQQLDTIDLSGGKCIGLAAGASTPEDMIIKVYNTVLQKRGSSGTAKCIGDIPLFKEDKC